MKTMRLYALLLLSCISLAAHAADSRLFSTQLSSNRITCVTQDGLGYIWVGTDHGLNKFDGYHFVSYLNNPADSVHSLPHNFVVWASIDPDGGLWAMTAKGLVKYNYGHDNFDKITLQCGGSEQPRASRIVWDKSGNAFVGTSGFGLYYLKKGESTARRIHQFSQDGTDDYFQNVFIDNKGRLWKQDNQSLVSCYSFTGGKARLLLKFKSRLGLHMDFIQGNGSNVLIIFQKGVVAYDGRNLRTLPLPVGNASLECAFLTRNGGILFGTNGSGVYFNPAHTERFEPFPVDNSSVDVGTSFAKSLIEDHQGNLWIGCREKGLLFVPGTKSAFREWSFAGQGVKTGVPVSAAAPDGSGGVWTSIRSGMLYRFDKSGRIVDGLRGPGNLNFVYCDRQRQYWLGAGSSLYRFNPASGQYNLFKTFPCDFISSMTDDGKGTLFVSTEGKGMAVVNSRTGNIRQYDMYQTDDPRGYLCNNWIQSFLYDSKGLLWCGTSYGVACYDPVRDNFKKYGWHNLLPGITCLALAENAYGNIVIGTDNGLYLFDRKANKVKPFPNSAKLAGTAIDAIVCDRTGSGLWCATSNGIWHYKADSKTFVRHGTGEFVNRVGMALADGRILFANSGGMIVFRPGTISSARRTTLPLHLTALLIGGEPVSLSMLSSLSYLDNSFTLEFSNFDYANVSTSVIEYRLNNDRWTQNPAGQSDITFTHLQPGTYKLHVRVLTGGTYSKTTTYVLTVRAPWYRSTLAYIVYILALLALLGYIAWRYWNRKRQQLAEEKMQLLINATHDIRTPLTMILSPLHKIMRKQHDVEEQKDLDTINHNANRILTLVNQILDIRKIDKRQMRLQCEETQMVPYINNVYKGFEPYAREHGITFKFEHDGDVTAWIDRAQFDKVIQNLLSNAFKFTPDNGSVELIVKSEESICKNVVGKQNDSSLLPLHSSFVLCVKDTGTGLREADIPKLFTRFYQSMANQVSGKDGTGIGLNLCKKIVELHHGTITAQNRTDGVRGAEFVVSIPLGKDHLKPEELKSNTDGIASLSSIGEGRGGVRTATKYRILLVDDDAEITDYISNELADRYHFGICSNGKEAINELLSHSDKYDLVVSDIMMPEIDGFTLLRMIKSNAQVSHIPVILLTTESEVGNRLEGLEHGADAFMAKPFLIDELRAQIDSILANQQRMKGRFSGAISQKDKVEQQDIKDNDKDLMDRIMKSVNKNIGESDYTVEQLASDVGLSRAQLHRRMKEMTGLSTTERKWFSLRS